MRSNPAAIDESNYIGHISNFLVKDNTKDPLTGKYMLQTYGQYNVGVLLVRFVQLYSLGKRDTTKRNVELRSKLRRGSEQYINIYMTLGLHIAVIDDLPQEVEFHPNVGQDGDEIVLKWTEGNRKDKLYKLGLNEDTGVISAHFYGNGKDVIKSSDGRVEYLKRYFVLPYPTERFMKHRPQNEGPAVITAEGDREYWENGEHIRTEVVGEYIKG